MGSWEPEEVAGVMVQPVSPWLVLFCGSDPPREKFSDDNGIVLSVYQYCSNQVQFSTLEQY